MIKSIFGALCDHWIDKPEQEFTKPINYVMAKNGCFEIRDTPLGRMTVRAGENIAGLEHDLEEGIELNVPAIPGSILTTILSFFRAVYHERSGAEAFLQIFYNTEEEEFFLHCPRQEVSGALVTFERDPELEARHILVMDIHSHNSMPAFFSSIDDADEQEDRLYGVIGCVHQRIPHLEFRFGVAGRFVSLEGMSLFDEAEEAMSWPREWMNRCEYAPFGHGRRKPRKDEDKEARTGWSPSFGSYLDGEEDEDDDDLYTSQGDLDEEVGLQTRDGRDNTDQEEEGHTTRFSRTKRYDKSRSWGSSFGSGRFRRRRRVESWGPEWDEAFSNAGEWVEDVQPYKPLRSNLSRRNGWFWS